MVVKKGPEDGGKWLTAHHKSAGYAIHTVQHDREAALRALVWIVVERLAYPEGRIHRCGAWSDTRTQS